MYTYTPCILRSSSVLTTEWTCSPGAVDIDLCICPVTHVITAYDPWPLHCIRRRMRTMLCSRRIPKHRQCRTKCYSSPMHKHKTGDVELRPDTWTDQLIEIITTPNMRQMRIDTPTFASQCHVAGHPPQWQRCYLGSFADEWRAAGSHHLQMKFHGCRKTVELNSKHVHLFNYTT